jgi:hypothetical protein
MRPVLLSILLAGLLGSCTHKANKPLTADYLIIGYTGGYAGNIFYADYLLITGTQCIKSSNPAGSRVPEDNSQFLFTKVQPAAKFDSVKNLLHSIPSDLLIRRNASFGFDGNDISGYDVRASINGVLYTWGFGPTPYTVSAETQQFVSEIGKAWH